MITHATEKQETYQQLGNVLKINHSHSIHEFVDEIITTTHYVCLTATTSIHASREEIIEAIMASKYTIQQEIAIINNQTEKLDAYEDYQSFRNLAKTLARDWLNKENK